MREPRLLRDGGAYFEGPRWHDGRWWVSDFYRHAVYAIDEGGREEEIVRIEGQPSGLGWMPDGSLLVVSMLDHTLLRHAGDGEVTVHADLSAHCDGHLNDLLVDDRGRAYAGNFGFDLMLGADPAPTGLILVEPDGTSAVVADGLWFPNGMVLDGDTLIGAETFACMLGGPDGRTLLLCAAPDFDATARSASREAALFTTTVDVPHGGRP